MSTEEALELMRSAWAKRRASFDVTPAEKRALLTQAQHALRTAVAMCRDQGSPVSHAEAVHLLANVEIDLGDEERARSLWEEAVRILRTTDDALQLAHKVRHLGDLHRHCGRFGDAEACYGEALTLYRANDGEGSLDYANAVRRVAKLKELQGDRAQALALWRETRACYAGVGMAPGVEEADSSIERLTP
jgi:tetratricopeptide (TPR) repeat protein